MSMKERMKVNKRKHLVRKSWGQLNPSTKVVESEKKYDRKKDKKALRMECEW